MEKQKTYKVVVKDIFCTTSKSGAGKKLYAGYGTDKYGTVMFCGLTTSEKASYGGYLEYCKAFIETAPTAWKPLLDLEENE